MKKRLTALFPVLLLLLASCGGEKNDAGPLYSVSHAKALVDAGAFSGMMEEVDASTALMIYGIDEADVKECACYMASNTSVSADEVTVLELTGAEAAERAETACEDRVANQIDSCTDYCPDQVPRLEDAVISRRENTVLLAVGDPDKLPQALKDLGL